MARGPIPQDARRRLDEATDRIRALLPEGWDISVASRSDAGGLLRVRSERSAEGELTVWARKQLEPRAVPRLSPTEGPTMVATRWLSPRTRELLRARGIGYLDTTGNVEIRLVEPGLYVRTEGAARDPQPKAGAAPSLRGPRVWAMLRTLVEVAPPYGVRDISVALGLDAGYISRVLRVLDDELLVTRTPRGPVTEVDWEGVLRQLVTTYSVFDANDTSTWVAPGGPDQLLGDLAGKRVGRWAVTGSFGSAKIAPVAAPEIALIYAGDPERVAKAGRLLPATTGANVILAVPYDRIVFERTRRLEGVAYVSVAQLAADDLTGNGRMPAEGEALLGWMRGNTSRWRASSLTAPTEGLG